MTDSRGPRIVIADGFATNPGDLSWQGLERLGELTVYDRSGDALVQRCLGASVILTNKEIIDAAVFASLPDLKLVSVLATGTNVVDLDAARAHGVVVSNVPAYSTQAVVQHVFALLLEMTNRVQDHAQAAVGGRWQASADFSFRLGTIRELAGRTLGVVGLGAIGRGVAVVAQAFGMGLLLAEHGQVRQRAADLPGVRFAPLDSVFEQADVITLHCPLTAQTEGLVDARRLALMKPDALLINTARGPLIDERALAAALSEGSLGGAAVDVLCSEPPRDGSPLLGAPRCLVTPHVAWASVEARQRLIEESVHNVAAWLGGEPRNRVA